MYKQIIYLFLLLSCVTSELLWARSLHKAHTTKPALAQKLPAKTQFYLNEHLHKLWNQCFGQSLLSMIPKFVTNRKSYLGPCMVFDKLSMQDLRTIVKNHFIPSKLIPKKIHQIFFGIKLNAYAQQQQETWLKHNPNWDYVLWKKTNKILNAKLTAQYKNYHEKNIAECDDSPLASVRQALYRDEDKEDFLKYEILAKYGGLYANWNICSKMSLDVLHDRYNFYLLTNQNSPGFFKSDIIGSVPYHPIISHVIDTIKARFENKAITTYPARNILITHAFISCLTKNLRHFVIIDDKQQELFSIHSLERCTEQTIWWQAYQNIIPKHNKQFTIIVPSYNNDEWYYQNLQSILKQKYPDYRVLYINDASTDNTSQNVLNYIAKHDTSNKIKIINNKINKGGLANIYDAVHSCDDSQVIVELDGDDWFANAHVLELLNKVYAHGDTWITYGQYTQWPNPQGSIQPGIPPFFLQNRNFRGPWGWLAPLRTFYAWLFKKIHKDDLLLNNRFMRVSWDHAFMWPMCEMAGDHLTFIDDLLYVYNRANVLSDSSRHAQQKQVMNYLSHKARYPEISHSINSESQNNA